MKIYEELDKEDLATGGTRVDSVIFIGNFNSLGLIRD